MKKRESSSRPASSTPVDVDRCRRSRSRTKRSSTPAALLHLPPASVKEGAGVEEAGVDEVRQLVAAGRGRF